MEPHPPSSLTGLPLAIHDFAIAGRSWRVAAVRDQDALLAASDRFEKFPFGLLLWDSAPALAEFLAEHPELVAGRRVLELGAGVGLAGLVARHLGADVRQTDHIAEALDLCRMNAEANGIAGVELALADWNDWRDEARYDVILGSDVLYDRANFPALFAIFDRNLVPGGLALLADPGRQDTPGFTAAVRGATTPAPQAPSLRDAGLRPCRDQRLRVSPMPDAAPCAASRSETAPRAGARPNVNIISMRRPAHAKG